MPAVVQDFNDLHQFRFPNPPVLVPVETPEELLQLLHLVESEALTAGRGFDNVIRNGTDRHGARKRAWDGQVGVYYIDLSKGTNV